MKVPHKRSRQEIHNTIMAKMVPKLEEENKPETMPEEKITFEAKIQIQDEVTAKQNTKIKTEHQVIEESKAEIQGLEVEKLQHET